MMHPIVQRNAIAGCKSVPRGFCDHADTFKLSLSLLFLLDRGIFFKIMAVFKEMKKITGN